MSATDHLNGQQFMGIDEVGDLQSYNYPGMSVRKWAETEGDLSMYGSSRAYRTGISDDDDSLFAQVKAQGIHQPLDVSGETLMEGHHRWAAARAAGMSQVPVNFGHKDDVHARDKKNGYL